MSLLLRDLSPEELAYEIRRMFVGAGGTWQDHLRAGAILPNTAPLPFLPQPSARVQPASWPEKAVDIHFDTDGSTDIIPVNRGPKPRHPALEECYDLCHKDWLYNTAKFCRPLWGRSKARLRAYAKCMTVEGDKLGDCHADCHRASQKAPRNDGY